MPVLGSCAALVLVVGLIATGGAGARPAGSNPDVDRAVAAIRAAIRYEDAAIHDASKGAWHAARATLTAPHFSAESSLRAAVEDLSKADSNSSFDAATEGRVDSHLQEADVYDRKAENAVLHRDVNSVKHWIAKADAEKKKGLAILEAWASAGTSSSLSSPAGSGPITVTTVKCYANGTGGNPERDADFSVKGAFWHLQEIYPATYVPGGSATKPMVFIEDMAAPYTEPGIHIYAGFGVTVSGDISTIGSGQQVSVNGSLVDPKGNAVAGSNLTMSFKCP